MRRVKMDYGGEKLGPSNESVLTFLGPNFCAKFHENRTIPNFGN